MSLPNRLPSFLATMAWEGGSRLSLTRSDPGNWTGNRIGIGQLKGTKWGVAAGSHPTLDIAALTSAQALEIFVKAYWLPIDGDALATGLDHCMSDDSYNAGPAAARRRFARIARESTDVAVISDIHAYTRLRLSFLESLRIWKLFGRGWARRCAGVEAESLLMAARAERARALSLLEAPVIRITASRMRDAALESREARCGAVGAIGTMLVCCVAAAIGWPGFFATHWPSGAIAAVAASYCVGAKIWALIVHDEREAPLSAVADCLDSTTGLTRAFAVPAEMLGGSPPSVSTKTKD
jgi:lysozyme family protein